MLSRSGLRGRRLAVTTAVVAVAAGGAVAAGITPAGAQPVTPAPAAAVKPAVQPPGGVPGVKVPKLTWKKQKDGFETTTLTVPYDYRKPAGRTFPLAVIRLPASNRKTRVGGLVFNFGGPGGESVSQVRALAKSLPAAIRARYDIVGIDPRGVGGSRPVRCSATTEQQQADTLVGIGDYPETAAEFAVATKQAAALAARCRARNGDLLDHIGTLPFARDIDVLRAAMGDKLINYYGLSYGTFLGQVLANLFPTRTGALIIDGVVVPEWAKGTRTPISWTREGYDTGAKQTLQEFFRRCDRTPACVFSGNSAARFDALAKRLRAEPLLVEGQGEIGYSELVVLAQSALYSPSTWPALADALVNLEKLAAAPAGAPQPARARDAVRRALELGRSGAAPYDAYPDAATAITCADTDNSRNPAAYPGLGSAREAGAGGYFGSRATFLAFPCAFWAGRSTERWTGPWNARTTRPVLVLSTTYDPATPYENAVAVSKTLRNARLLTVDGVGHTTLGTSRCSSALVEAYLVKGTLPKAGTHCAQSIDPFAPPALR